MQLKLKFVFSIFTQFFNKIYIFFRQNKLFERNIILKD